MGKEAMVVKMAEISPAVNELIESHPQSSICMPSRASGDDELQRRLAEGREEGGGSERAVWRHQIPEASRDPTFNE